jgi:hypothetical protein
MKTIPLGALILFALPAYAVDIPRPRIEPYDDYAQFRELIGSIDGIANVAGNFRMTKHGEVLYQYRYWRGEIRSNGKRLDSGGKDTFAEVFTYFQHSPNYHKFAKLLDRHVPKVKEGYKRVDYWLYPAGFDSVLIYVMDKRIDREDGL